MYNTVRRRRINHGASNCCCWGREHSDYWWRWSEFTAASRGKVPRRGGSNDGAHALSTTRAPLSQAVLYVLPAVLRCMYIHTRMYVCCTPMPLSCRPYLEKKGRRMRSWVRDREKERVVYNEVAELSYYYQSASARFRSTRERARLLVFCNNGADD